MRFWDTASGSLMCSLFGYYSFSLCNAISPGGKRIVLGQKMGCRYLTLLLALPSVNRLVQRDLQLCMRYSPKVENELDPRGNVQVCDVASGEAISQRLKTICSGFVHRINNECEPSFSCNGASLEHHFNSHSLPNGTAPQEYQ